MAAGAPSSPRQARTAGFDRASAITTPKNATRPSPRRAASGRRRPAPAGRSEGVGQGSTRRRSTSSPMRSSVATRPRRTARAWSRVVVESRVMPAAWAMSASEGALVAGGREPAAGGGQHPRRCPHLRWPAGRPPPAIALVPSAVTGHRLRRRLGPQAWAGYVVRMVPLSGGTSAQHSPGTRPESPAGGRWRAPGGVGHPVVAGEGVSGRSGSPASALTRCSASGPASA